MFNTTLRFSFRILLINYSFFQLDIVGFISHPSLDAQSETMLIYWNLQKQSGKHEQFMKSKYGKTTHVNENLEKSQLKTFPLYFIISQVWIIVIDNRTFWKRDTENRCWQQVQKSSHRVRTKVLWNVQTIRSSAYVHSQSSNPYNKFFQHIRNQDFDLNFPVAESLRRIEILCSNMNHRLGEFHCQFTENPSHAKKLMGLSKEKT